MIVSIECINYSKTQWTRSSNDSSFDKLSLNLNKSSGKHLKPMTGIDMITFNLSYLTFWVNCGYVYC